MILAILAFVASAAQAGVAESVTIVESECYSMEEQDGRVVSTRIPGLRVIERTAGDGPFAANLPAGTSAVLCPRSTIVPAPNDWKVLVAGYPLYIMETSVPPESRRVGTLEVSQGQVRYRLIRGEFHAGEEERLRARLDQFQESARE
jgi:hypothetical protein